MLWINQTNVQLVLFVCVCCWSIYFWMKDATTTITTKKVCELSTKNYLCVITFGIGYAHSFQLFDVNWTAMNFISFNGVANEQWIIFARLFGEPVSMPVIICVIKLYDFNYLHEKKKMKRNVCERKGKTQSHSIPEAITLQQSNISNDTM